MNEIILKWGFEIFSIINVDFQRLVVEIVQTAWLFWINPCVLLTSRRKIGWNSHLFFLQTIGYQCGRKILDSRAQWPKWMGSLVVGQAAHGDEHANYSRITPSSHIEHLVGGLKPNHLNKKIFETGSIFPNFLGWRSQNMSSKPRSPPTVDVATKLWKSVESGHLSERTTSSTFQARFSSFF